MVIYDLICANTHVFEGWFADAEDFQRQRSNNFISCPVCESTAVDKKVSAPKVSTSKNSVVKRQKQAADQGDFSDEQKRQFKEFQSALHKVHDYIDANYDDVGNQFAQEAISIQEGDSEHRNIRGTASAKEVRELHERGVAAMPLPARPPKKLN